MTREKGMMDGSQLLDGMGIDARNCDSSGMKIFVEIEM
jgi:hypothetical protein